MPLTSKVLAGSGFLHGFSTRDEDERVLPRLLSVDSVVRVTQVHGGRVVDTEAAAGAQADAIVARATRPGRPGDAAPGAALAVGVQTADCVPLLLADPETGDVAAVHAGWRGVVAHVVTAAVDALGEGPRAARLLAAIGPCIGPCCFEVGRDVACTIARACGETRVVVREAGDQAYVDLRGAVRAELRARGVREDRIEDVAGCTKHEGGRFHSFRRDGKDAGRMLAAIATRR